MEILDKYSGRLALGKNVDSVTMRMNHRNTFLEPLGINALQAETRVHRAVRMRVVLMQSETHQISECTILL